MKINSLPHGPMGPFNLFFRFLSFPKLLFCLLILFAASCQKKITENITVPNANAKDGPIPSYQFDWETADVMPSNPADMAQVPMPWNSGTTAIDPNIVSDFKSADGWQLVWNTFSPTQSITGAQVTLFFALYNIYRGQLRFYLWQPPANVATTYVSHGLSLYNSTNSNMLNFNGADMIDLTNNQTTFSGMVTQPINISGGTWYVFQYEIAYDQNVATTSFPDLGLAWISQYANVTQLTINGTQIGTITGEINPIATGASAFPLSLATSAGMAFLGATNYTQVLGILGGGNTNPATNPFQKAFNDAAGGVLKGLLGAIVGANGTSQSVNLTFSSSIQLQGSFVNNGGLENNKLVLPGQLNAQTADGLTPAYPNLLGLFNVVGKPVVRVNAQPVQEVEVTDQGPDGRTFFDMMQTVSCWFDDNSINLQFNPAVINSSPGGAHIENLHKDLVMMDLSSDLVSGYLGGNMTNEGIVGNVPQTFSTIINAEVFTNPTAASPATMTYYYGGISLDGEGPGPDNPVPVVRISFDVVTNAGVKMSSISKTFVVDRII